MVDDRPAVESGPITEVVKLLARSSVVMTAAYEGQRNGVVARSAQICADDPLLLAVSVCRGHSVDPLIRDSHGFALCLVDQADRFILQKFAPGALNGHGVTDDEVVVDPFTSFKVSTLWTGSPVFDRCRAALDCEVVRHFDLEADHELYVGHVVAARFLDPT